MTPSSWLTSTIVRSSSSVISSPFSFGFTLMRKRYALEKRFTMKIRGVRAVIRKWMTDTFLSASRSARMVAIVFGEISPKISMTSVKSPVPIPTARLPPILLASTVASADALKFTMLLPIRMVVSILPCSSSISSTRAAFRLPFSARERRRWRFTVVSAVSEAEKNEDR